MAEYDFIDVTNFLFRINRDTDTSFPKTDNTMPKSYPPDKLFSLDSFVKDNSKFTGIGFNEGIGYQCVSLVKEYVRKFNNGNAVGALGLGKNTAYNLSKVHFSGDTEFQFINRDRGYYEMTPGDVVSSSSHTFILKEIERDKNGRVTKAIGLEQAGLYTNVRRLKDADEAIELAKAKDEETGEYTYTVVKDSNDKYFTVDNMYRGNFNRAGITTDENNIYTDARILAAKDDGKDVVTIGLSESDLTDYVNNRIGALEVAHKVSKSSYYHSLTDVELAQLHESESTIGAPMNTPVMRTAGASRSFAMNKSRIHTIFIGVKRLR